MKQPQRKRFRGRHSDAFARATTAAHVALALWFAYWAWQLVGGTFSDWPNHLDVLGVDGRLYYRASALWLAGGDPWTAATQTNTWPAGGGLISFLFCGSPLDVLAFAPFAWIPEWLFVIGWFGLTITAAVYILRRLHLGLWWLAFPPLAEALIVANPHVVTLALLLAGSDWLCALAAPLKVYAVIPMVGERRWRALAILTIATAATIVLFQPLWSQYAEHFRAMQSWLNDVTSGGQSATVQPDLWVLGFVSLAVLGVLRSREAGWLAVPILWPAAQDFYASFILPLRSPWLAAALALADGAVYVGWFGVPSMAQILVAYTVWRALYALGARLVEMERRRRAANKVTDVSGLPSGLVYHGRNRRFDSRPLPAMAADLVNQSGDVLRARRPV
jgi:hypothetical protein